MTQKRIQLRPAIRAANLGLFMKNRLSRSLGIAGCSLDLAKAECAKVDGCTISIIA
jgi:hypothetical protein